MDTYSPTNKRLGGGKAITPAVPKTAPKKHKATTIRDLISGRKNLTREGLALCLDTPELESWTPSMEWHTKPPTDRQFIELGAHGVPSRLIDCAGFATFVLDVIVRRKRRKMPSLKMVAYLYKYGVKAGEKMTWAQASSVSRALSRSNKIGRNP